MKVTLNELINNRESDDFTIDGNTFTAGYKGEYVQAEYCGTFCSDDISDEHLREIEADNMEEFREEVHSLLTCGFNEWNEDVYGNDNASGGMDMGFIPERGYLMEGMEQRYPCGFGFPGEDNTKDMFQCEVHTPEHTWCTLTITLNSYNLKCDKEYKVMNVESHDDWEDNPMNFCDFGAWVSDKCYYKLWKRYLALTHKDV